jgi:malate permease and related proteins
MVSLIILFVCLLIGVGLRYVKTIPQNAPATLGALILYVPLPAVCLLALPDLDWNLSLISLFFVMWIVFGMAFLLFPYLGRKFGWDKSIIGCLILTAGFCNSAFVGFPIIDALLGKEALKHAIFLDQSGSFLIVSSFGIWIALTYSSGKMRKRILFKKILLFPPFIAFIVGISAGLFGWRAEGMTREVLERLSSLLTPLALISVGLQLQWNEIHEEIKYLALGLSFKLILAPLIIFTAYYLFGVDKNIIKVSVMESGMAPMITSSILAASHNLRPRLAGMMVGVGVPISFITLGGWYFLLTLI